MVFYLIPVLLNFILAFFQIGTFDKNSKAMHLFIYVITIIIFCFGYMTGSDWRSYEPLYNEASIDGLSYYDREKGFYVLMLLFKALGITFFPFLCICKTISFMICIKFLQKYTSNIYLTLFVFLCTNALFIFVDNPLRFMIALSTVLIAYDFLFKDRYVIFILFILLSATFHISSLILLPLIFFYKRNLHTKAVVILYFLLYAFLTPYVSRYIIDTFFPFIIPWIHWYYKDMLNQEFSFLTIGKLFHCFLFVILVMNKKHIESISLYGKIIYNLTICYFFISLIGSNIPTFFRLALFFSPFLYITITSIILRMYRSKRSFFIAYFILFYFILSFVVNIKQTFVYIPYSNYLTYLFKKKPSFEERSLYNYEEYYKRTGKGVEKKQ